MKRIMIHITIVNILYIFGLIMSLTDIVGNDTLGFKTLFIITLFMVVSILNIFYLLFKTSKSSPYYKTVLVFAFVHLYILTALILAEFDLLFLFVIPHVELVIYLLFLSEKQEKQYKYLMFVILAGSILVSVIYSLLPEASYNIDMIISMFVILFILHGICCSILALIKHFKSKKR